MHKIIGQRIFHFSQIDSTNNRATEKIRQNDILPGDVFWADEQTQGRGQQGNTWQSEPGKNLLCSLYIEPRHLKADQGFLISQWVSISMISLLESFGLDSMIKWPNDILVHRRKIAGILIENGIQGQYLSHSIIGIGLNINQTHFPNSQTPYNPVSLRQCSGKEYILQDILNNLLIHLEKFYPLLLQKHINIQNLYTQSLFQHNVWATYQHQNQEIKAQIQGVNKLGQLLLIKEDQSILICNIKELGFFK